MRSRNDQEPSALLNIFYFFGTMVFIYASMFKLLLTLLPLFLYFVSVVKPETASPHTKAAAASSVCVMVFQVFAAIAFVLEESFMKQEAEATDKTKRPQDCGRFVVC